MSFRAKPRNLKTSSQDHTVVARLVSMQGLLALVPPRPLTTGSAPETGEHTPSPTTPIRHPQNAIPSPKSTFRTLQMPFRTPKCPSEHQIVIPSEAEESQNLISGPHCRRTTRLDARPSSVGSAETIDHRLSARNRRTHTLPNDPHPSSPKCHPKPKIDVPNPPNAIPNPQMPFRAPNCHSERSRGISKPHLRTTLSSHDSSQCKAF